jgi:hypothetical protein
MAAQDHSFLLTPCTNNLHYRGVRCITEAISSQL